MEELAATSVAIVATESRDSMYKHVASDLEGIRALTTDAVAKTTQLVEAAHTRYDWISRWIFPSRGVDRHPNPIAGLVYDSIHIVNGVVGYGLSAVIAQLQQTHDPIAPPSFEREAKVSVLNGVLGDYLLEQGNSLAINEMQIRIGGVPQTDEMLRQWIVDEATKQQQPDRRRFLILIHGSCANDLQWKRKEYQYGEQLESELGLVPMYIYYNTGLRISENGKLLALQLNRLVRILLVDDKKESNADAQLHILAHSMGGLVARSACYWAGTNPEVYDTQGWLVKLRKMVFLGSPHHGALLEQGGKWVDYLLAMHHYSEPFSWLGKIRSQGVMDLGYGNIREEDWKDVEEGAPKDRRQRTPLPEHVECFAIAAVLSPSSNQGSRLIGDGLVTENSALGIRPSYPELDLGVQKHLTVNNLGHLDLLCSPSVYEAIALFYAN